jgi:predicted flap endonuclease-1-like 5' DNA nuclease
MTYLLSSLLLFIIAAFVLGLAIGWITCRHQPREEGLGWMWVGLIVFVFGLFISASKWIKGSAGLWFDTAMWLFGAYILGCLIGCLLHQLLNPEKPSALALGIQDKLTSLPGASAVATAPAAAFAAMPVAAATPAASAAPAAVRPYQWQAAKDGRSVTLTGYAPSGEARDRLASDAQAKLAPAAIIDKLRIGSGAPAGMETMTAVAHGHLARLDRGIASLIDSKYTLTGVAGAQADYDAVIAGVRSLPAGFSLAKADIVAPPAPAPKPATAPKAAPAAPTTAAPTPAPKPAPAPKAAPKPAPAPEPKAPAADLPPPAARIDGEDKVPGKRPPGYASPIGGKADDLKRIRGIGKQNEGRLHGLGIWHFDQIAQWVTDECLWVGSYLAFPGRIEREEWVKQAKVLAAGMETEFSKRVAKGEVATSQDGGDKGQENVEVVKPMRTVQGSPPKDAKKS